jgi:hypothetical protein
MKVPNFIKYAVVAVLAIASYQFIMYKPTVSNIQTSTDSSVPFLEQLDKEQGVSAPEVSNSSKDVVLIKVRNEPKVIEAMITDAKVLYVSVRDDGTRRTGYAEYLCMIAKSNFVERVKVIKVNSQNDPNRDNSYGVLLGESWCK